MSEVTFELILQSMMLSVWKQFFVSPSLHKRSQMHYLQKKRKRKNQSQYVFFKISQPCIDNHLSACLKYSDALFSQASIEQSAAKT